MKIILYLIVILISYGSLYPFSFVWHDASVTELLLLDNVSGDVQFDDLLSNIILFIPYGAIGLLIYGQCTWRVLGRLSLNGMILAIVLQIIQVYLPARVAALTDALINGIGILIGFGLAWIVIKGPWRNYFAADTAVATPILLVCFFLGYRLFPLMPEFSWHNVRLGLTPMLHWTSLTSIDILHDMVSWLLCFYLIAKGFGRDLGIVGRFVLVMSVLSLETLILNNQVTPNNLAGGLFACLAHALVPRFHKEGLLSSLLLLSLVLSALSPFVLQFPLKIFDWAPFRPFLMGDMWANTQLLIDRTFLYGCFLYLIRHIGPSWAKAGVLGILVTGGLEAMQVFMSSNPAEISDPLLVLMLTVALAELEYWEDKPLSPAAPKPLAHERMNHAMRHLKASQKKGS